ncbi:MAG: helix-turn-helix domain-containing protein [Candidatus Coatesbacteria bacterium]
MKKGMPKYLTTTQAGRLLGVSTFSIQRWFNQGHLTGPHLPGGKRWITVESFLAFAKKHEFEIDPADIRTTRD